MAGFRQRGSEAVSPCVVANVQDVLPGGRRWPPQWANRNGTKRAGWREAEKASSPADLPDGPGCLYRQNHPGRIASYHPGGRRSRSGKSCRSVGMPIFDRSSDTRIEVKLPHSQEPMGFAETAIAVFVGLWGFAISLWIVSALLLGTILRGALEGFSS